MTVVDMEAVNEVEYNFGKSSKAPKDMNAPKKPLSAFFLWANHARAGVQIEHPGASIGEIGMLLGNLWKIVSEDERERFVIQAEKNKVLYEREKEKYQKSAAYKSHLIKMHAWKIHLTKRPFGIDPYAPKKPMSAYMLYTSTIRKAVMDENPEMTASEMMREQSVWWKALSGAEQEPWVRKAEVLKARYQKKLDRYQNTAEYRDYEQQKAQYKAEMVNKRNQLVSGVHKRKKRPADSIKASPSGKKRRTLRSKTPKSHRISLSRSSRSSSMSASRCRRKKSSRPCRRRVARRTRAPKGPNSSTLYHQRRARGEKTPKPETSDQRKTPLRPPKHKNKFWSRRRIARLVKKRVSELGTLMHKKYSEPKKKARVAVNNDKGYRKASARREKKRIEKCTSPRRQTSASRGTSRRRRARRRSHRSRSKSNTSSRRTEASKIVRRSRTPKGRTRKRTTRRTKRSKRKSRKRFYSRSRSISHSRNSQRSSSRYTKSRSRKRSSRTTARKGKRVRRHRRSIQENYTSAEETTVKVYKKPVLEDSESDYVIEGSEGFVLEDSEGIVEDSERLAVVGCIEEVPSVVQVDPETTGNEETESEPVL